MTQFNRNLLPCISLLALMGAGDARAADAVPPQVASADCSGYDLRLLLVLDDEPDAVMAGTEARLAAAKKVCAARKLCLAGRASEALALYQDAGRLVGVGSSAGQ